MEEKIDKFLELISDPRNIKSEDFAKYYPKIGEKYNSKNLDKHSIEKYFESLRELEITENWKGYIPLKAKLLSLLESFNRLTKKDKEVALNYYVLANENTILKTQSFVFEKTLSKKEYYNLLGVYTVFSNNLNSLIINEFKESLNANDVLKECGTKKPKRGRPKTEIKPFKQYICKNWNPQGKTYFTNFIKTEFKEYKEEYNAGKKKNLNLLAHALIDQEITTITTKKSYITSVLRLILETKKEFKASEINNFRKLNGYQNKPEYTRIVNKIKGKFDFMKTYEELHE